MPPVTQTSRAARRGGPCRAAQSSRPAAHCNRPVVCKSRPAQSTLVVCSRRPSHSSRLAMCGNRQTSMQACRLGVCLPASSQDKHAGRQPSMPGSLLPRLHACSTQQACCLHAASELFAAGSATVRHICRHNFIVAHCAATLLLQLLALQMSSRRLLLPSLGATLHHRVLLCLQRNLEQAVCLLLLLELALRPLSCPLF